jgi:hypothetical protein
MSGVPVSISFVIPAQAGTQFFIFGWAPAFAGVTKESI